MGKILDNFPLVVSNVVSTKEEVDFMLKDNSFRTVEIRTGFIVVRRCKDEALIRFQDVPDEFRDEINAGRILER